MKYLTLRVADFDAVSPVATSFSLKSNLMLKSIFPSLVFPVEFLNLFFSVRKRVGGNG